MYFFKMLPLNLGLDLPSPYPSLFRTAKEFWVTWSKLRSETAHAVVCKTSVSHFKVKNTPLKDTSDGKGKIKTMLSFLLVDKGRLFFPK